MQFSDVIGSEAFDQAIVWMNANPNLAGWAQAVGATVAIFIAIAIPAWQRHAQLLDMRRQHASLHLALASMGSFLLGDVLIFLEGLVTLNELPRSQCRDDPHVSDLLQRIHALESREISHARIVSLYIARGALTLANRSLSNPDFQGMPLYQAEIENLKRNIFRLNERIAIARYDADFSICRMRSIHSFGLGRPIGRIVLYCWTFFNHKNVSIKDRIHGIR